MICPFLNLKELLRLKQLAAMYDRGGHASYYSRASRDALINREDYVGERFAKKRALLLKKGNLT